MKKLIFAFAISIAPIVNAQIQDSVIQKKLYVKANALFLPIGVLNAGLEYQLNEKMTLQGDVFISPWKSFGGKYAQIYMMGFDGRYYFKEAFKHWYAGVNFSAARYIIQKYNYWNDGLYQYNENAPVYITSDLYQNGFSLMIGATVGYQWMINEKWNIDMFVGGGHSEGFYHGYHKKLGVRYEDDGRAWNRSGEWLPYRGGLMISYRLK